MCCRSSRGGLYFGDFRADFEISGGLGPISLVGFSALRVQGKPSKQRVTSSFRKRSKQWPVPGRETEKLAYVRAGNFGRFLRLWAIIDVSESGVVRLNGPKTSPERPVCWAVACVICLHEYSREGTNVMLYVITHITDTMIISRTHITDATIISRASHIVTKTNSPGPPKICAGVPPFFMDFGFTF